MFHIQLRYEISILIHTYIYSGDKLKIDHTRGNLDKFNPGLIKWPRAQ